MENLNLLAGVDVNSGVPKEHQAIIDMWADNAISTHLMGDEGHHSVWITVPKPLKDQ